MTIYLAICDNNIADRKQLERLLSREKDRRLRENYDVLYIDSFGSEEALMATPVKYDIFFVDVTEGASNGIEIAKKLRQRGISAPIVLCQSTINYSSYVNAPEDIIYIEKPINAGQVSHLTDVAFEWSKRKAPLIEIRCQKDTRFIRHDELVKATPLDKFLTRISLSDGECVDMTESLASLEVQCMSFGCFVRCGRDLINVYHIEGTSGRGFRLSNGDIVTYSFTQKNAIIKAMADSIGTCREH
ncbi:MAG: hypothetical protein K6G58_09160 [Lachnospiraceae bacterium]|nr:hypothetical protein [Lachnospiraceae bacterium]